MSLTARAFTGGGDVNEVVRVVTASFGGGGGEWHSKRLGKLTRKEWKNHRCLELDGRIVSYLEIVPKRMYIGRSLLKMAGVGGVSTDPAHRKKGYNRALFEDTIEFMRKDGYDLSILYGIPDYYHRYGYESVMTRHIVTMPAREEFPGPAAGYKRSVVARSDMEQIRCLCNAQARYRDGNCLRDRMHKPKRGVKITDARGRIAAYATWREENGIIFTGDAAARNPAAGVELLKVLWRVAWRELAGQINVDLPPGYPLTDAMLTRGATYRRQFRRNQGCMGRIVDLSSLARKMCTEWARLVGRSELARKRFALRLAVGDETLRISASAKGVTAGVGRAHAASKATQQRFAQMLLGYRAISELADDSDVRFAKKDLRALEVLFPERRTHILGPDRF
ncbi:MAG: GNAT family N-acetyltransferase [Planctomycetota bacterium]